MSYLMGQNFMKLLCWLALMGIVKTVDSRIPALRVEARGACSAPSLLGGMSPHTGPLILVYYVWPRDADARAVRGGLRI